VAVAQALKSRFQKLDQLAMDCEDRKAFAVERPAFLEILYRFEVSRREPCLKVESECIFPTTWASTRHKRRPEVLPVLYCLPASDFDTIGHKRIDPCPNR
jgi:hypothetical protein